MERHLGKAAFAGCLSGLVGAACMAVVAILAAAVAGRGWYFPFELAGGLVTGSTARFDLGLQTGVALVGVVLHFALGAGWGMLFGILIGYVMDDVSPGDGVWMGALFGVIVWVIDLFALAPKFDPAAARAIPLWFGALIHLGFGALLGLTFHRFRRWHEGEPEPTAS